MTDRDRVQLLVGPYKAPPLKRGDRATCLFRDCGVVVTGWTDARVPWPRCRALDSPGGGSGLLVDEELTRAVRHESAAAVMFWWGGEQDGRAELAARPRRRPHRQRGDRTARAGRGG